MDYSTGIECEVGEYLYGLVRMLRPTHVLETGTRLAIAARYMALGLQDNGQGHLLTIERDPSTYARGMGKLRESGFGPDLVTGLNMDVRQWSPTAGQQFDLLWLDTEPEYRYQELLRFYDHTAGGGIICIHDLADLSCKFFLGVPERMADLMRKGLLRALTFRTQRGLTICQKAINFDTQGNIFRVNA